MEIEVFNGFSDIVFKTKILIVFVGGCQCANMLFFLKVHVCLFVVQELMVALQNHILDFIQRLHSVEIERRQLLTELGNLKTQIAGLGSAAEAADGSGDRVSLWTYTTLIFTLSLMMLTLWISNALC